MTRATVTREKSRALKRAETEFAKQRAAIESDEDMSRSQKDSALRVAATEYERAIQAAHEGG